MEKEEKDSSSDDSEEEEVEPKLRYQRLKNDVPEILKSDAASCMAVHTKFLAVGTHLGIIHILDHQGNNIRSKELVSHATTVNHISIDDKGNYMASCSNDGKVVLCGIFSSDLNVTVTIDRPVRSVSVDPNFSKSSSSRRFIIGEDKVVLYEKSILGKYRPTVLYQGEGPIRNIRWRNRFVVWSSDKTVRLYDLAANITITVIQRDFDSSLRPELYRCNFFWKDDKTLLVAWANTVKVCNIVPTNPQQMSVKTKDHAVLPRFYVEITALFSTDFYICGISSMANDIVVLTVVKNIEVPGSSGLRPQLKVLQPNGEDFKLISNDILSLHGYQAYRCNDYHLGSLTEEGLYFILSPRDFVIARPRDHDDHVAWLIEHKQFEEAFLAVQEDKVLRKPEHTVLKVGQRYLNHLLELEQFDRAAKLCSTIFKSDKQLWEEEVYKFAQIRQLCCIAPHLPTQEPLDSTIYEMVLNEFLQKDPKGFLQMLNKWPHNLYSIPAIINAVLSKLVNQPCEILNEALCRLYMFDKNYDEALNVYLKIKSKDEVFKFIEHHKLYRSVNDKLEYLMELNPDAATNMFLKHLNEFPITSVVTKLSHKPKLLFEYLKKMVSKDPMLGQEHHELLVKLYAEYAPEQLLSFLRSSNNYALEDAFSICQQRNLIHEMIFLLNRMGNTEQALQKIMHDLENIEWAINFCKEHDDKELWENLIKYSLDKAGFITVLLQNIGTHVDPIILIEEIPNSKEIPGLRDSLVKILHDYNLQISLREGCEKILVSDCFSLLEKLNKQHKRGILINEDQVCQACHRKLLPNDFRTAADIFIFNCRHGFHKACVSQQKLDSCSVCSAQKKRPSQFLK